MIMANEMAKQDTLFVDAWKPFLQCLAPFAPHIAEEFWQRLGHEGSISHVAWPVFDETLVVDDEVQIVVQVNGKVRARFAPQGRCKR